MVNKHRFRDVERPAHSPYTARAQGLSPSVLAASLAVWTAFAVVAPSCGGGNTPPQLTGTGGAPPSCSFVGIKCEGTVVLSCEGGVARTITDCAGDPLGGTCSRGRCTSPRCAQVELKDSGAVGCLFYAAGVTNVAADADETDSLLVTNPGPDPAHVDIEAVSPRRDEEQWTSVMRQTVPSGLSRRFRAPFPRTATERENPGVAVRVSSDQPVTVVQLVSDDADETSTNSAGTMLLPFNSLRTTYLAMAYPQRATAAVDAIDGRGGAGRIVVIAVADDTVVSLTRKTEMEQVTLQEGDVAQFWSGGEGDDLGGTRVTGSKPIVVLSGNLTTSYGREITGSSTPDMTLEVMLPVAYWSRKHVAAALPPQAATCDTLFERPDASLWRVMAALPGTEVRFFGPPAAGLPAKVTLGVGEIYEALVSNTVSFTVEATEPVMVTQGMDCEPSLSLAVPVDQMLSDLSFAVPSSFVHLVDVVRRRGEAVTLDNDLIAEAAFAPAGPDYEVAQLSLAPCTSGYGLCTHHLIGSFGMTLRGMDAVCSYALTAPTWPRCENTLDDTCGQ